MKAPSLPAQVLGLPGPAAALGLGMRGGPRGRRWSWRRSVPPAIDIA